MSDVGQAIGTVVGGVIGFFVGGPMGAAKGAALGYSVSAPRPEGQSPTYSFGKEYNTASQTIPVPVIYGRNKVAGNIIYKKVSGENNEKMALQVAVGEGPINAITKVMADGVDITDKCTIRLGNRVQSAVSINDQGQTFPYTAYISVELTANENISGNPTITCIVEGRKVEVWNGSTWVEEYSQNPAYCLLDFMTNRRYGLGKSKNILPLDSYITVAQYCDELIDDGKGGREKRFELDYVIDFQKSSLDHIQDILSTFRSFLIYSAGDLRLKVDGPEGYVQSFDMDNIATDENGKSRFTYWKTSKKDRYNRIVVEYTDPDDDWQRAGAKTELDSDIKKRGIVDEKYTLLGINRFSQAGRQAKYFRKKSWYCTIFCQFPVGIDGLHCEAGDVVKVAHDVPGWAGKLFRILTIQEDENEEMILTCQEYNPAVYNDSGVVQQVKTDTTLPNPFEPPASVADLSLIEENKVLGDGTWVPGVKVTWEKPDNIFWKAGNVYISADNGANWSFVQRVEDVEYTISNLAPGPYKIKVQSENDKKIKEDFGAAAVGSITVIGKDVPPSDVTWGPCSFGKDIKLNWQSVPDNDIKYYEIRIDQNFGSDDENLIYRNNDLKTTISNPTQRSYTFYIKAMDRSGNYSENAVSITLQNSIPSTPPQPDITEFFTSLWITINPVSDTDIQNYNLYMTPCDLEGNPTGDTEKIPYPVAKKDTYQADPGSSFLVQVSAEDVLGEGEKSAAVLATTKYLDGPDIPDGLLEESKLADNLTSKINTAKNNSDSYANQIIAYPTEEDEDNQTTANYQMKYSSGDIYVGTEIETDPDSFFDLTDQNDDEITDTDGNTITVLDVVDENGDSLIGAGKPTWYGEGSAETVTLNLSAVPESPTIRVHYGVKKKLSQMAVDGLIKKGVTAKQTDANLISAIENLSGFAWNQTIPDNEKLVNVATRISSAEGNIESNQTAISANADEISSNASRITSTENGLSAAQSDISQNADSISQTVSRVDANEDDISTNTSKVTQMADQYGVKIEQHANGKDVITGFEQLITKEGISEFGILVDRFKIYGDPSDPDETATPIFALDTQAKKVYLLADLIADGTITARMVGTNEIITNTANIAQAVIDDLQAIEITANDITAGKLQSGDGKVVFDLDNGTFNLGDRLVWDGEKLVISNSNGVIAKPQGAHLWHFDRSVVSTDGIEPEDGAVYTLRPREGRFGGAVAVEKGTTNQFVEYTNGSFEDGIKGNECAPNQHGYSSNIDTYTSIYDDGYNGLGVKVTLTTNSNGGAYLGYNNKFVTATEDQYWSHQFKLKKLTQNITYWGGLQSYDDAGYIGDFGTHEVKDLGDGWELHTISGKSLAGTTKVIANIRFGPVQADTTVSYIIDEAQLEQKPFATSFVDGARADGTMPIPIDILNIEKGTISQWIYVKKDGSMDDGDWHFGFSFRDSGSENNQISLRYRTVNNAWFFHSRDSSTSTDAFLPSMLEITEGWHMFTVTWNKNNSTLKSYFDGELQNDVSDAHLPENFSNTYNHAIEIGAWSTALYQLNSLIDEMLISPIEASDEQIAAWHNSNAPFVDSEPNPSFGDITAGDYGMIINGTKGVKLLANNGDYSTLNSDMLAFYKAGYDTPHWYSRRVAYGVAQDGDYIDLAGETGVPWDRPPKVITAIKSLRSYTSANSGDNQTYESYADGITKAGFYTYGHSIVPSTEVSQTGTGNLSSTTYAWISSGSSISCSKVQIKITANSKYDNYYSVNLEYNIYYKKSSSSEWTNYGLFTMDDYNTISDFNMSKTYVITNLPKGVYDIKIELHNSGFGYINTCDWWKVEWSAYDDTTIANGEVMWIAVEGGAD